MLKTGMDSVASAILSCVPRVYIEDEIFEEVLKVEGLDEDSQRLAYDYLCEDAVRGRAFIGLPINRRKAWLELKLSRCWLPRKYWIILRREHRCSNDKLYPLMSCICSF